MGLLFILTASECTNQEMVSRLLSMCCVSQCACAASVYCQARKEYSAQTLLHAPRQLCLFLLRKQQRWLQLIFVSQGCDLECRTRRYGKARLGLFPAGAPSCSFISVPRGTPALSSLLLSSLLDNRACTLRCSNESL